MMHHEITCFIMLLMIMMTKSNISFVYHSNRTSARIFDCLYGYILEDLDPENRPLIRTNNLTPYCRRVLSYDDDMNEIEGYIENKSTFKSLRLQGIQSEDLVQWSASIDIIEQYAVYLNKNDTKFDDFIYNNCSSSWFGSNCQYTFDLNGSIQSFGDYVVSSLKNRKQYKNKLLIHSCYPHLSECYRGPEPMCLDWREICDGKIDCIGGNFGIDEKYCDELEMHECTEDEYRCLNGAQCIPLEFFRDGWTRYDCLDGTDEVEYGHSNDPLIERLYLECIETMLFACEETTCRYPRYFSCGDGNCLAGYPVYNTIKPEYYYCLGTNRDGYYQRAIYMSAKQYSPDCYKLLFCKLRFYEILKTDTYSKQDCLYTNWSLLNNCAMKNLSFPVKPLFYGYFQFVYSSELLVKSSGNNIRPYYICNDRRLCLHWRKATSQMYGLDCRRFQPIEPFDGDLHYYLRDDAAICQLKGNINNNISNSSLFYCEQSDRYISKHRLIDGIKDCYHNEDETYTNSCLLNDIQRFNCTSENKCLSPVGIGLNLPDCPGKEDHKINKSEISIFPRLCTIVYELKEEDNETDENNCKWWPCDTPYTRCDNFWHCANGIDELNCPNTNCEFNEYECSDINSNNHYCTPKEYIYEMRLNCNDNNPTDLCRHIFYSNSSNINMNNDYISWKENICITENDVCDYQSTDDQPVLCNSFRHSDILKCSRFFWNLYSNEPLCYLSKSSFDIRELFIFSTYNLGYFPSRINSTSLSIGQLNDTKPNKTPLFNNTIELIEYCNRGIIIFEGKSYEKKCLCPPNYFGDRCQWQNQRVSLTLQIRTLGSYEKKISIYDIFIYLIDDQHEMIDSYEEINYIPSIDCETKYNRYLLYSTQPKNTNKTYFIHIDIYDKLTLNYYGSWYLFIPFPFLPVNRIATQIKIPLEKSKSLKNCSIQCGNHGQCFSYFNSDKSFCHCDSGYSGRFCNLIYNSSCASGSVSLSSSICLCSLKKFGSKCYLKHKYCLSNNNPCQNQGQCIPVNDRINKNGFICLCSEDSMGSYCEYQANRIDLTFETDPIPSLILAHFITAFNDKEQERTSTFKKILFDQNSVSLFIRQSFHIVLIEFSNNYYLSVLREKYFPGEHISTDIKMNDMCVNITQLLNSTLLNYSELRRLKYYPLQCFQNRKLKCFYDEKYMCVCDKTRFSNCFKFDHNKSYDCKGHNYCQHDGKCFHDNDNCPSMSVCMCKECYHGSQCQLTTNGFSISLDVILGYYIKPSISFFKQSHVVKITASLTIIMFSFGFLNGLLCILTFRRESLLQVGCGIYLLTNSSVSILTIFIFVIKYYQLIFFQMNIITNRSFIYFNCILIDVLLKILLSFNDWLNACVAIERVVNTLLGVQFNKTKSKSLAKYIILIILFLITVSYIYDPISRQLFDDKDEKRTWCIVIYSSRLNIFDKFINLFHFLTPFIINIVSAIVIIIQMSKIRAKTQKKSPNTTLLRNQIREYKHLLISPCILILLAVPRLVILFASKCLKSTNDPWLFLVGYYISFVPPLLIFVVFILPSEKYKEEFFIILRKIRSIF